MGRQLPIVATWNDANRRSAVPPRKPRLVVSLQCGQCSSHRNMSPSRRSPITGTSVLVPLVFCSTWARVRRCYIWKVRDEDLDLDSPKFPSKSRRGSGFQSLFPTRSVDHQFKVNERRKRQSALNTTPAQRPNEAVNLTRSRWWLKVLSC